MKTKPGVVIFLLAATLTQASILRSSPATEDGQTNTLTTLLQKGLFEEQANRNLNGFVSLKPELRPEILALAGRRNVFMADAAPLLGDWFAKHLPPAIQARHLRVSLGDRERIHVAIESLQTVAKQQIS